MYFVDRHTCRIIVCLLSFNDGLMNQLSRKQRFEQIRTIYQMSTLNIIILDLFVDILEAILFTCIVLIFNGSYMSAYLYLIIELQARRNKLARCSQYRLWTLKERFFSARKRHLMNAEIGHFFMPALSIAKTLLMNALGT